MAAADLRSQLLAKHSQILSIRCANVSRKVAIDDGSSSLWRKQNQLRKLGGGQPREAIANVNPTEGQAAVAVETVPAQVGDVEKLAPHGLHGVAEQCFYFTDPGRHTRPRPPN